MDYDALLNLGTELGYKLVLSGAEIYRVEESVLRLLTAYGLQPQVFALPSCLIVSVNTPAGHPITQMRRVPPHGTDIELLERCNDLCRQLCREVPPLPEAAELGGKAGAGPQILPDPGPAAGLCGSCGLFYRVLRRDAAGYPVRRPVRPGGGSLDAVGQPAPTL